MANRLYAPYPHALMTGTAIDLRAVNLRFVGVDTADYTVDTDTHEFLSSVPAAARVATTGVLQNVTVVNRVLDADDITMPDTGGDSYEALILYVDTGVDATSRLIAYFDTVAGLPLTPDNVSDLLRFHGSGIFQL